MFQIPPYHIWGIHHVHYICGMSDLRCWPSMNWVEFLIGNPSPSKCSTFLCIHSIVIFVLLFGIPSPHSSLFILTAKKKVTWPSLSKMNSTPRTLTPIKTISTRTKTGASYPDYRTCPNCAKMAMLRSPSCTLSRKRMCQDQS